MLTQNKQYLAQYLLYLFLFKENQSNWSHFERLSWKPSTSYALEKRSDWCRDGDSVAEVRGPTNSARHSALLC